jgi:hypothetical protein
MEDVTSSVWLKAGDLRHQAGTKVDLFEGVDAGRIAKRALA